MVKIKSGSIIYLKFIKVFDNCQSYRKELLYIIEENDFLLQRVKVVVFSVLGCSRLKVSV